MTKCCKGTLQVSAQYLNLAQALAIPYGTAAHAQAYRRRNIVEAGNSYLDGTYIDLSRTCSRLMETPTASSCSACSSPASTAISKSPGVRGNERSLNVTRHLVPSDARTHSAS